MKREVFHHKDLNITEIRGHNDREIIALKLAEQKRLSTTNTTSHILEPDSVESAQAMWLIRYIEQSRYTGKFAMQTVETARTWLDRLGFPVHLSPNVILGEEDATRAIRKNRNNLTGFQIKNAQLLASIFEEQSEEANENHS